MQKLLAFLVMAMLVIGSAFTLVGPVHINGPGLTETVVNEYALAGEGFALPDAAIIFDFPARADLSTAADVSAIEIAGSVAGDLQGIYSMKAISGIAKLPIVVLTVSSATPDRLPFGDIGLSQEVISLRGGSKPNAPKMLIIL